MSSKTAAQVDEVATKPVEFSRAVYWDDDKASMFLVDQRILPSRLEYIGYVDHVEVAHAIRKMVVRGAPAIGAAGAFAMALCGNSSKCTDATDFIAELTVAKALLDEARPTAVNLAWATGRLLDLVRFVVDTVGQTDVEALKKDLLHEAKELAEADVSINKRLGAFGASVVKQNANILHHCNTGRLATVDYGTALGVIYSAHEQGKNVHVWVDETRPRLQGARLSAWELMRGGVPLHLIADNAAGLLMLQGKVDIVVVGADRVAANGDVVNKIGTYKLAVCAKENGVPFFACVPASTIDLAILHGKDIPIEERSESEVSCIGGVRIAPEGCPVYNPAFDITPFRYLSGIITEEGICYPPYEISLRAAKEKAEARIREAWDASMAKYKDTSDGPPPAKKAK